MTGDPNEARADAGTRSFAYRPSLDGLRGAAVLAVIAYHLELPFAVGGFLGVDVFFVLSGFLITSLLLIEHGSTGRIDLAGFWTRRARRLLPALWAVVAAVAVAAVAVGSALPVLGDALASIFYVANWRFIALARTYFAEAATSSPLQHVWSLAIEEQFYLVWPLLVGVMARWQRRSMTAVLLLASVASALVMVLLYSPTDPTIAYFHTGARAHELFVGAVVAVVVRDGARPALLRRSIRVAPAAAVGIAAAMVALPDTARAYYLGGSLAFAAAVAVLLLRLEVAPDGPAHRILASRPLVEVGRRSYGAYLWHWPVIVYLGRWWEPGTLAFIAVAVGLTGLLTEASLRWIELPIRRGSVGRLELTPRRLAALVPVASLVLASFVIVADRYVETPSWIAMADQEDVLVVTTGEGDEDGSMDPGATLTVGVVGDSVAASMLEGLESESEPSGIEVVSVARRGCTLSGGFQVDAEGAPFTYSQRCDEHVPNALERLIAQEDPDIVIWYSGREMNVSFRVGDEVLEPGSERHREHVAAGFDLAAGVLTSAGAQVIVIEPIPRVGDRLPTCHADAIGCSDSSAPFRLHGLSDELRALVERNRRLHFVSVTEMVCGAGTVCERGAGGVDWRPDGTHLSHEGSRRVARELLSVGRRLLEPDDG